MTHRIYLRWPKQRISNRTSTESELVAKAAFKELTDNAAWFIEKGALGISHTEDGKQINYMLLNEGRDERSPGGRRQSAEQGSVAAPKEPQ